MVEPSVFKVNPGIAKRWDNFYVAPNFDHTKAARRTKTPYQTQRSMAPTHIRCEKCGHLLRKGTKQYSKLKKSFTEEYVGMPIYYISFRCPDCKSDMAIKTDPKTNFYLPMKGCTLPFLKMEQERWKQEDGADDKNSDDELDTLQRLEKLARQSRQEAKNDEFLENRIEESAHLDSADPSEVAERLRMQDESNLNSLNNNEEAMIEVYKEKRIRRQKEVKRENKFAAFTKKVGVGKGISSGMMAAKKKKNSSSMMAAKKKKKKKKKKDKSLSVL